MEWLSDVVDKLLHLDKTLGDVIQEYGAWTYGILTLIVFMETAFVVTPFLPGDSLLFAAGTFAAFGKLEMVWITVLLSAAAIVGDTVNYHIGYYLGPKVFRSEKSRFFRREYLDRTRAFYERYGPKTIVIARFVPIIRTFAPFVAGVGRMSYPRFLFYNAAGGIFWVVSLSYLGYFFGTREVVQKNFSLVILAIIAISCLPAGIEFLRERRRARADAATTPPAP